MEEEGRRGRGRGGRLGAGAAGRRAPAQGEPACLEGERGHQKVGHKKSREDFMVLSRWQALVRASLISWSKGESPRAEKRGGMTCQPPEGQAWSSDPKGGGRRRGCPRSHEARPTKGSGDQASGRRENRTVFSVCSGNSPPPHDRWGQEYISPCQIPSDFCPRPGTF